MRAATIAAAFVAGAVCGGVGSVRLQADQSPDRRVVDAVKSGNDAVVISLLKQKADVNVPEADGTTAISWAVRQDDVEMVDRLIKAGANVKTANRYGVTPLYLAALNGDADVILKRQRRSHRGRNGADDGVTLRACGGSQGADRERRDC